MFHLYMDEDSMAKALVGALRYRDVPVITALEAGMINHADAAHLDYATTHGYVLFSFNTGDYLNLHAQRVSSGQPHSGIILALQQHYSVGETMKRLLRLMATKSAEDMIDH